MIDQLRKIGLSDLEARCYLTLYEEPDLSGYEIAKRVSVSRTNVYAALRALKDKGMCRTIEANPVLYTPVPIDEMVRLLQTDFEQTAKILVEELRTPPKSASSFYNWQGDKALETVIRRVISNADKHILVDIWSEDVHWIEESLAEAEKRGVDVTLIVIGESHTSLKHVITHKRSEEWDQMESRKFSILCDSQAAVIGSFGKAYKLSALETDHPSITELLKNDFYHDLVMKQIEEDFKAELDEKYGTDYENIIQRYKEILS
ncbi:TrmB family transcriptional regulator [Cytobacillus massiliigabonensis]|uniref:TrmB family transcriptional regulator n=1 Tax=Cytobacillus massiliigabonensis TaxID=1871011 RepID=UPI000C837F5A|nr:helix-turn-helix domain-containing protein [Cytobacillus massiliigabonensis]